MSQLAFSISSTTTADTNNSQAFGSRAAAIDITAANEDTQPITKEIIVLGVLLAALQVMDGVLTYLGVSHFGLGAEANGFVRYAMHQLGPQSALILLKSVALVVVVVLCHLARSVSWLRFAMKTIIAVYIIAAIIPWTTILLLRA